MDRQFPPEIIQLIVEASLTLYDPYNEYWSAEYRDRYSTLVIYSLLNSTWRGVCEPLLFEWVIIRSPECATHFLEAVDARGGQAEGVRGLIIESHHFDATVVSRILRSTPFVVSLVCDTSRVDVVDLARLLQLRRLRLNSAEVEDSLSAATLSLRRLVWLDLHHTTIKPSASRFLSPSFLPQLRYLSPSGRTDNDLLLPQLHAFDLDWGDYRSLSLATSLRLFQLPEWIHDRFDMYPQFASLPPFLSIDFELSYFGNARNEVRFALQELINMSKSGLRVVLLRDWRITRRIKKTIRRLERKGVRVEMEQDRLDFPRAIQRMEEILAEEEAEARAIERSEWTTGPAKRSERERSGAGNYEEQEMDLLSLEIEELRLMSLVCCW